MNQKFLFAIIAVLSIIILSCEEDLNPNADFIQRNILTSVLRSDTTFQLITLSRSYEIEGLNPLANTDDHSITGADVKVWHNNKVYQFVEDSLERVDKSRYDYPVRIYYTDSLQIIGGKPIEIEALLPNGILLKSSTNVPSTGNLELQNSTRIIHPDSLANHLIKFWWSKSVDTYYHPVFVIRYYNRAVGDGVLLEKEIPLEYNTDGSKRWTVPSGNNAVAYPLDVFLKSLNEIVEQGTGKKENYSIIRAELKIMIYDKNLSTYYSSVATFLDGFTIKVDQSDFSNIEGGFGIFGSFTTIKFSIVINDDYLKDLGFVK